MNEKILPDDIESKSLSELTDIADHLIQELESKKNLEESIDDYQYLIKLNNLIEKKFQKDSKNISESTKLKIEELTSKKNEKKLVKTVNEVNKFLKNYLAKQKKTDLIIPIKYGLFPGGKKIRSKLIFDVGKIFNVEKKYLLYLSSAVECIHAYSLIHDDLPCMDDDDIRRGKLTTHKKFGESTAVLAGNSLLTLAFEILSDPKFNINNNKKISLINLISQSSGHQGIAGGQFLDLNYERKKVSKQKVIDMEIKKTGKLFSFSCLSPVILTNKKDQIKKFSIIGEKIGLLFQIADDLIDYSSSSKTAGKKTNKDSKKGKATLISLLGYKNAIKYASKLKKEIFNSLISYGNNANDLKETIEFILSRNK